MCPCFPGCAGKDCAWHDRELIKTGQWSAELGIAFDLIWELRDTGDYGGIAHVTEEEANQAVEKAAHILDVIKKENLQLQ